VVDATDRERIGDCRHELAGLLLEEVGVIEDLLSNILTISATIGRESTSVQEQERCSRRYERGRGSRGGC
jgi:hypothetical protein